ncbi:hypothetical protein [Leptospira weilii]|uniref:Uncharacterized protein n=1 Tax=Leptospira weilii str. UI 13098 TaxID=1088542 RepID=M6Q5B5_9LEPT|nr:hypothetical protein [Leptospira weilii]EMN90464.1 hypothetical protein LEP1GSC108_2814 [Leptospira weilii str. UI 13098]
MDISSINIILKDGTMVIVQVSDMAVIDSGAVNKIKEAVETSGVGQTIKETVTGG